MIIVFFLLSIDLKMKKEIFFKSQKTLLEKIIICFLTKFGFFKLKYLYSIEYIVDLIYEKKRDSFGLKIYDSNFSKKKKNQLKNLKKLRLKANRLQRNPKDITYYKLYKIEKEFQKHIEYNQYFLNYIQI